MGKDAWGGAIELQILAEYFQAVIAVVDTKSGRGKTKKIGPANGFLWGGEEFNF